MRICTKCGQEKSEQSFYWLDKEHTKREWRCKACCIAAKARHIKENPEHAERVREGRAQRQAKKKERIIKYLATHPCVDCGEDDIQVLQFDHIEPVLGNRKRRVGGFVNHSMKRLMEEIAKCEIRCANCHVRRTRKQFGWELIL